MSDIAYECVPCSSRADWLEKRKAGIGASECAAVLGLSPYSTEFEVWARKTGRLPEQEANASMQMGNEWEPHVRAKAARLLPDMQDLPPCEVEYLEFDLRRSRSKPHIAASLDGVVRIGSGGSQELADLEVKVSDPANDFANAWTGKEPPAHIRCQVQHQLFVTGFRRGFVAVQIGLRSFRIFEETRDDEFIEFMVRRLDRFWAKVQSGERPSVDSSEPTREALSRLKATPGKRIALPAEWLPTASSIDNLKERIGELKDQLAEREAEVKAALDDATEATLPDGSGWTFREQYTAGYTVEPRTNRVLRRTKAPSLKEIA